ncbi:hypothetical protein C8R45DRAFT_1013530 [Mycena sanguinolenta]|nr:hypothetical protein C8R45DRAFT_1013530 [Mycena sanguinolenta]
MGRGRCGGREGKEAKRGEVVVLFPPLTFISLYFTFSWCRVLILHNLLPCSYTYTLCWPSSPSLPYPRPTPLLPSPHLFALLPPSPVPSFPSCPPCDALVSLLVRLVPPFLALARFSPSAPFRVVRSFLVFPFLLALSALFFFIFFRTAFSRRRPPFLSLLLSFFLSCLSPRCAPHLPFCHHPASRRIHLLLGPLLSAFFIPSLRLVALPRQRRSLGS